MTHQFAIRDQHGTSLRSGPAPGDKTYALPATADSFKLSKGLLDVEYSANGELALAVDSEKGGVNVYDANDGSPICAIPVKAAAAVAFSPSGSFVQTWEKLTDELQNAGGNLRVWSARTG